MNNFYNDDLDQYLNPINLEECNSVLVQSESNNNESSLPNNSNKNLKGQRKAKGSQKIALKKKNTDVRYGADVKEEFLSSQNDQALSLQSLDKKQRNRMAAKLSRDRKKLYIQLMEYEHKKLEKELADVGAQMEQVKGKINRFCSQNKTVKLQEILDKSEPTSQEQEIMIVLDSMSFRMGATGKQRVQKQKQCHKQMINLFLPPLHRYIMWTASENKHLWDPNFEENCDEFICPLIPSIVRIQDIKPQLQKMKFNVVETKEKLMNLINILEQKKQNLENVIKKLEFQVDYLRDVLNPSQCAKLLIFANSHRYRKQLLFFEQDEIVSTLMEGSLPHKKVKKEQEEGSE